MKNFLQAALFFIVSLTAWQVQATQTDPQKPLVILVSLDGFKPSYLSDAQTPHLLALARQGALSQGLISSFPSLTFPNHITLVSGQTPDHHGIVNNTMIDPAINERFSLGAREAVENPFWWQESRPIWVTLRQQGKIASTLFWPGSETEIQGTRPHDWLRYNHDMTHEARLNTLMSWLSRPIETRPDFVTLYFSDVDSAGHYGGPDSDAVKAAVRKVDESIGHLISRLKSQGLLESTSLVIVSDHGMANSPAKLTLQVKELLSAFPAARWEWLGATAGVRLHGENQDAVLRQLSSVDHMMCWPKADMPKRFKFGTHRRIPDIVCLAQTGYSISDNPDRSGPVGQHGYDPEDQDMHGLLIASGFRIRQADLGLVMNTDIYSLLCNLLNIKPGVHDGSDRLFNLLVAP